MKYLVVCVLLFFLIDRCYFPVTTHGHEYLDISFDESKVDGTFIQYYIDSVLNKGVIFPDSIKSQFYISSEQHDIDENQKLVHFRNYPEEWYLIGLETNPCWIEAIYNPSIRDVAIFDKKTISGHELERIKNRFQIEILNKSELYAEQNHISDSIVYKK